MSQAKVESIVLHYMAAGTLSCAVINDPTVAPSATTVIIKSPYPANGSSARADLRSRHTRWNKNGES